MNSMKKFFTVAVLMLLLTLPASAQFESGKWIVNPSLSGMDFTFSKGKKAHFGLNAQVGAFLVDQVALLVNGGLSVNKMSADVYNLGVGGRYYFDSCGVYLGTGINLDHWKFEKDAKDTDVNWQVEAGYAFFLSRTVTIEPAVYYKLSMTDQDYSEFGLKVGFGFYF